MLNHYFSLRRKKVERLKGTRDKAFFSLTLFHLNPERIQATQPIWLSRVLEEMQICRLHPRSTESDALGGGPATSNLTSPGYS